jgi:uncharacterized protein YhhL (DUF1145 family)
MKESGRRGSSFTNSSSLSVFWRFMLVNALIRYPMKGEWMTQLCIHLLELVISVSSLHGWLCISTLNNQQESGWHGSSFTNLSSLSVSGRFMLVNALTRYPMKGEWMTQLIISLLKLVISFSRVHAYLCTSTLDNHWKESAWCGSSFIYLSWLSSNQSL